MRRRQFFAGAAATALTWPLATRAQQQSGLPVVRMGAQRDGKTEFGAGGCLPSGSQ